MLNYMTLPIIYSEDFYNRLTNMSRYSTLAYYKDVLVGAISCKFEDHKDDEGKIRLINDDHVCNHEDEDDHSHHKILKTMSNIDLDSKKDEYDSDDSIKDKD